MKTKEFTVLCEATDFFEKASAQGMRPVLKINGNKYIVEYTEPMNPILLEG
jgi:hypothetical protein